VCSGRVRVLAGGQARLGPRRALLDVDLDRLHLGEVQHDPVVDHAVRGPAVATAADSQVESRLARESDHT
jgi:hypothetical protein